MYLTKDEIKQLKEDLMSTSTRRNTAYNTIVSYNDSLSQITRIVKSEVKSDINCQIEKIFENNVRQTLEFEYNWQISNYPRHFFYRNVYCDRRDLFLSSFSYLKLGDYIIYMDSDNKNCYFKNVTNNKIEKEITNKSINTFVPFKNYNFFIGPPKEMTVYAF